MITYEINDTRMQVSFLALETALTGMSTVITPVTDQIGKVLVACELSTEDFLRNRFTVFPFFSTISSKKYV